MEKKNTVILGVFHFVFSLPKVLFIDDNYHNGDDDSIIMIIYFGAVKFTM